MKARGSIAALLTAIGCMTSYAGFEQFAGPKGYMNVSEVGFGGVQGAYLWGSDWGLADLRAITSDNRNFVLLPNTNVYNESDPYWSNGEGDGNKWMEALTFFEITPITSDITGASFSFTVDAFDLDPRYSLVGFIKVLNPGNGYAVEIIDQVIINSTGSHTLSIPVGINLSGMILQAGWAMSGINANPSAEWGSATVTATALDADTGDTTPPSPDPMTFDVMPFAISDSAIAMTATPATDASAVEYYFTCTSDGAFDSGWQGSTNYVASGLAAETEYFFTVVARDLSAAMNTNTPSSAFSATTFAADNTKPTPDPMTFSASEASPVSIKLTATIATDDSAVEYFFDCISGDGHDSGWQSSHVYVDTGLVPGSNYIYTVTARDTSAAMNTTDPSDPLLIATLPAPASGSLSNTLKGFSGDSSVGTTLHELALAGFEVASTEASRAIDFTAAGAQFDPAPNTGSRNIIRTIAADYGDADFEVYATFITQNGTEQAGFIGAGQGIIGNYGVPDFELAGVNAFNAEAQANWCKVFTWTDGAITEFTESEGIATITNRFRMVHIAASNTISFALDTDYAGGDFVADRLLGTHSTSNIWQEMPQRIYIAAGAGVIMKDLQITASSVPVVGVDDLVIHPLAGGGVQLMWTSTAGQTYDVEYRADLSSGDWTGDPSPGCLDIPGTGGSITATSTVDSAKAFYRIATE